MIIWTSKQFYVKQFCKTILIISRFKQETIDKRACQRHAIKASEQIKSAKRKKKKKKNQTGKAHI